jgi:bla regulator protein blaR1
MTPWMPSALIDHLWQSTLFAFVVWLAAVALRGNGARVRWWLWTAASVKFLLPLSVLVSLGERIQWRAAPAVVQPTVSFVMEDVLAPVTMVVAAAPASIPQPSPVWPWLLLTIWCAGATAVLFSWWRQWLPIQAALRGAVRLRLDAQHGADGLEVLSSPRLPEPGVVGIWRPRLVLPDGIVQSLTPTQLRALIAHERCHIDCHDNLAAALHMVVEALFWFHPVVWWIEGRLVDERERACDEAVLRAGSRPQDYAEAILEVCRRSVGFRLACVAGVSGSHLRARVEAIMRNEMGHPMTRGRRWALAVAVVAAVAGPVVGGALTAQSQIVIPPQGLAFEAASVKAIKSFPGVKPGSLAMHETIMRIQMSRAQDGRFRTNGLSPTSLYSLIQAAYDVTGFQIDGGPPWVRSDWYAIDARAAGNPTPDQKRGMLQSLLADRFKLALRRETRSLPVYELVVADAGLKIAPMKEGDCTPAQQVPWETLDLEAPLYLCDSFRRRELSQNPETRPRPRWPRVDRLEAGRLSVSGLIAVISGDVDRLVIDKTGVTTPFNLLLDFARGTSSVSDQASPLGPTIFTALEDQLGLRLVPAEAPVDVLVIESVERPAEN